MSQPIEFQWDGDAMVTIARCRKLADQQFVVGQVYSLIEHQQRSKKSHDHFFVLVEEAFQTLPDSLTGRWPSADHMRKEALIKTGYCDTRTFVASSKAEAARLAAFMRPGDSYALYIVRDAVVTEYKAKSQSLKAMGRADFQASKDEVLTILAGYLDVAPATLAKQPEPA